MPYVILRYVVEGKGEACLAPTRGIDSLLAMTTGRTNLVYVLETVPKVCELMHPVGALFGSFVTGTPRLEVVFVYRIR